MIFGLDNLYWSTNTATNVYYSYNCKDNEEIDICSTNALNEQYTSTILANFRCNVCPWKKYASFLYTNICELFILYWPLIEGNKCYFELELELEWRLKEHCTQKEIWIHLMQNIFRNQTVKNLTILDNPFKRYDFSKFSLNSVKSLCRPHKLATVPCHGCTTPHWFCTQIITNFQFSWIWVKLLIKLIPKSIQIHIYPKQHD